MIYTKVNTPVGIGEVVSISTPFNGLFIDYNCARVTIWYGTDGSQNGKVSWEYSMEDIEKLNPSIVRDRKINSLI